MRFILLIFALHLFSQTDAQPSGKIMLSAIVLNTDSVPVPDVAIINSRTGKTVRTNPYGFFQTEIGMEDSLLVYHIAYRKQFISEKNNGKYIILEPEIQELMQVDITDKKEKELQNLEETLNDIKRIAPKEKPTGYDLHSRQDFFYRDQGTHTKGFSPFFGPTQTVPLGEIAGFFSKIKQKKQRKKLTSHYHLVKKKKQSTNEYPE